MKAGTRISTLDESAVVERVARIISSVRGTKPDYTKLAAELAPAIPFDIFGVVLLRHDRQAVRVTVCRREGEAWRASYHQHPLAESRVEQMLADPVMLIENYPEGADGPPAKVGDALSGHPQLRSAAIVPLAVEDRVLGTLELGSCELGIYDDPSRRRLIEAVGRVLATAIEGVQAGGSVQIQDRQREALKAVSSALASRMDLPAIFHRIVTGVAEALRVSSVIVTLDREKGRLHLEAQSGLDPTVLASIVEDETALSDACIIGFTLRHRQPQVSNDIGGDPRFPASKPLYSRLAIRSIFVHPLVSGSTVYGALLLCSEEPGGFTPLKVDILSLFASQATIAIHNGILLEAARRRRHFQKILEQLEEAQRGAGPAEEERLLALVRAEAERTFGVSFASLLRFICDLLLTRPEQNLQAILQATEQNGHQQRHGQSSLTARLLAALEKREREAFADEGSASLLTQAEEALERASILGELSRLVQLHERLPGHLSDAWLAVDLEGNCIYMNPAAEGLCGIRMHTNDTRPLEEVFAELLPLARQPERLRQYLRQFTREQVMLGELRCAFAAELLPGTEQDGEGWKPGGQGAAATQDNVYADRYYLFTRHPVCDQQGCLKAYALQIHDITEQVRDEKNKSALLSSVSHDLRTPLTSIKAAVTGLLEPGIVWDEETRREILREVDAETDHLTVLVNALIEMSRIEMGALTLEKEWCDVAELLHSALQRLGRLPGKRSIRPHLRPPLPLLAQVDYAQMERVFYNLLENAVRHSPPNAEITVELEIVDGMLRARIIDRGYELPEGERERIFKTFYSLDPQGSGLSLAICRGIIEAHRGRIWVESAPGGGAIFIFTMPVCAGDPTNSVSSPSATLSEEHR
jgi:signal transduction histidine kinase/GAF domain-containing protein